MALPQSLSSSSQQHPDRHRLLAARSDALPLLRNPSTGSCLPWQLTPHLAPAAGPNAAASGCTRFLYLGPGGQRRLRHGLTHPAHLPVRAGTGSTPAPLTEEPSPERGRLQPTAPSAEPPVGSGSQGTFAGQDSQSFTSNISRAAGLWK